MFQLETLVKFKEKYGIFSFVPCEGCKLGNNILVECQSQQQQWPESLNNMSFDNSFETEMDEPPNEQIE